MQYGNMENSLYKRHTLVKNLLFKKKNHDASWFNFL